MASTPFPMRPRSPSVGEREPCHSRTCVKSWPYVARRAWGGSFRPTRVSARAGSAMSAADVLLPEPDPSGAEVALPKSTVHRISSALRDLLAQRTGQQADTWRQSVLHNLRTLTSSDRA